MTEMVYGRDFYVEPVLGEKKMFTCPTCGKQNMKLRRSTMCRTCRTKKALEAAHKATKKS